MVTPLSRIQVGLGVDEFRARYVDVQQPVIVAGLQESWPARTRWDSGYLRDRFGGVSVPVRTYGDGSGKPYTTAPMKLGAYLDWWDALDPDDPAPSPNLYLAEWNFSSQCPDLLEDFEVPDLFADDWIEKLPANVRFGRLWIFVGHPAVHTPTHTDTFGTSAWLATVRGAKVLRLLAPQHAALVQRGIDLFDEDTVERLRSRGAELFEAVVEAGDTLFVPGRWFHQVRNRGKSIMVTKNFVDTPNLLFFLSEFETRLVKPIQALRGLRNAFVAGLLDGGHPGTLGTDAPDCLRSPAFVEEQLGWAREMDRDLEAYRTALQRIRTTTDPG